MKLYLFDDLIYFGQLVSPYLTWITNLSSPLSKLVSNSSSLLVKNTNVNSNITSQTSA